MSFTGRVVIISGAGSGIGKNVAIAFAREGALVVLVGRTLEKLLGTEKSCAEVGEKPLSIAADVTNSHDVTRIIKESVERFGRIDILVNNAGILRNTGFMDEGCMEVYDEVMNINVRAALELMNAAFPYLIASKGNVINMSSIGGISAPITAKSIAYCVSKAALIHMSLCAAAQLATHGVRVNSICPGPVRTDCADNNGIPSDATDAYWDKLKYCTALKRLTTTDEIANLCLYIASEKGSSFTGSNIVLDNGMMLVGR